MSLQNEFKRELDRLYSRRTSYVRKLAGISNAGPAPDFTRRKVAKHIDNLEEVVQKIMVRRLAEHEFNSTIEFSRRWHPKRGKGWGVNAKKTCFRDWFSEKVDWKYCIYVFWTDHHCEYVGKTCGGAGRPLGHFEKFWFSAITQIDIYAVKTKSQVPKAECLAIDRWNPRRNDYAASRPKYAKRCPVCSVVRDVREELKSIFRMR